MTDSILFKHKDITIDKSIARFGETSYPIAHIGSVSTKKIGAGLQAPFGGILFLAGLVALITKTSAIGGIGLIVLGGAMYYLAKPKTALVLRTSSGDQQAFKDANAELVAKIKQAIESAIVSRG